MGLVLPPIEAYQVQPLPLVKAYADKIGLVDAINAVVPTEMEPTFKGVWLTGAHFASLPLPDTRPGQYPRPHKQSNDPPGCHGPAGWAHCL